MRQKKAVTRELRDRYRKSSKKEKTIMLNEFIQLTRYNRSYAARTLRTKEVLGYMNIGGKRVRLVRDKRKIKRKKKKIYDQEVLVALKELWIICDYICSKRLAPFFVNSKLKVSPDKIVNLSRIHDIEKILQLVYNLLKIKFYLLVSEILRVWGKDL